MTPIRIALFTLIACLLGPALAVAADVAPAVAPVAREGRLAALLGLVVALLTQLSRSSAFGGFVQRQSKPRRFAIMLGTAAAAAIIQSWLSGSSWGDAAWNWLVTSGVAVLTGEGVFSMAMGLRTGDAPAVAAVAPGVVVPLAAAVAPERAP